MTYALEQRIKQLENQLSIETQLRKSEVQMNQDILDENEKLELQIETLNNINQQYSELIAKLRNRLKKLVVDKNISTSLDI